MAFSVYYKDRFYPITQYETLVGRSPTCSLVVENVQISRHHCRIRLEGNQLTIADLGSKRGTFVNGKPVRAREVVVRPGDRVQLAHVELQILELSQLPSSRPLGKLRVKDRGNEDGTVHTAQEQRVQALARVRDELGLPPLRSRRNTPDAG